MALKLEDLLESGETALTRENVEQWRADGSWEGRTIRGLLRDAAAEHPDRPALVGYRTDGSVERLTYAEFDAAASQAAGVLAGLGVGPGDVVAVMLPNWVEYAALIFAINELGAVYTGVPVAYGERQAEAILRRSGAKVLVVPQRWRSVEHLDLARKLRTGLPGLSHLVVFGEAYVDLRDG